MQRVDIGSARMAMGEGEREWEILCHAETRSNRVEARRTDFFWGKGGSGRGMAMGIDEVTGEVVDAAMKVHMRVGPGLLESVYGKLLGVELVRRGLTVERQKLVVFEYDGIVFSEGLRLDMLVNEAVIVELKSTEQVAPVHAKQLLTYLRLLDLRVGLLINFGGATLKEGLRRVVNNYQPPRLDGAKRLSATPGGVKARERGEGIPCHAEARSDDG
ncbi:hypothetical protein BH23GEM10_BH23GEM10_03690 [soil metagenome]